MTANEVPDLAHPVPRRTLIVFGGLFLATYLLALLPPIYIGATKLHYVIAGLPFSVWYLLSVCVFAGGVCCALYVVERSRKELD